jgi:type 1 fimbria pilin
MKMKMKKILSLALCLMLGVCSAMADELTVSDITIPQGGKATLSVSLTNTGTYRQLFEFVLTLPEGVSMVENSQALSERFGSKTSLDYSVQGERVYKFVCSPAGTDKTPISGNSGVLMTVELQADATLALAASLEGSVTNIELTTSEAVAWNPADLSFAITIGAPADTRIVLDEASTTAPEAATGVDVRVLRTIKAGEWSTICLPFAMTEEQVKAAFGNDVKLAEFTGWETTDYDDNDKATAISVSFNDVSKIEANIPYIIKVSQPLTEFTADGVEIDVEDEPSVTVGKKNKGTLGSFTGSYVPMTIDEECLFLNGNQFWYSTGKTTMKGYRAYFYFQDVLASYPGNASSRISMTFDESTGIRDNIRETISNNRYYDLQGRRVAKPVKGLYIKNGKKVVNK